MLLGGNKVEVVLQTRAKTSPRGCCESLSSVGRGSETSLPHMARAVMASSEERGDTSPQSFRCSEARHSGPDCLLPRHRHHHPHRQDFSPSFVSASSSASFSSYPLSLHIAFSHPSPSSSSFCLSLSPSNLSSLPPPSLPPYLFPLFLLHILLLIFSSPLPLALFLFLLSPPSLLLSSSLSSIPPPPPFFLLLSPHPILHCSLSPWTNVPCLLLRTHFPLVRGDRKGSLGSERAQVKSSSQMSRRGR